MKLLLVPVLTALLLIGCGGREQAEVNEGDENHAMTAAEQDDHGQEAVQGSGEMSEEDLLNKPDPAGTYGAGVHAESAVAIAAILENPEAYLESPVRVEGTVSEVCPMRGCWMDLTQDQAKIRIKVDDGAIVFPLSAKGKHAVVEGKVEKIELTAEQAKGWMEHEAQEMGEAFDPASVTGPMTIWRIRGSGAEIEG